MAFFLAVEFIALRSPDRRIQSFRRDCPFSPSPSAEALGYSRSLLRSSVLARSKVNLDIDQQTFPKLHPSESFAENLIPETKMFVD
jgi:hypothetical protein